MRIIVLVVAVVFFSAWHSRTDARPIALASGGTAVDYHRVVGDHPTSVALARAIDIRLTVSQDRSGEPVHVQHCRTSDGGCRARIAALSRLITEASNRAGVDPFLTAAIAMRESGLNPLALSPAGARGLIQLNPRYRGKTVPFVYNARYREKCGRRPGACQREVLEAGLGLFDWAVERCGGDVKRGLAWYNSGRCDSRNGYAGSVLRERRRLLRLAKAADPDLKAVFAD